MEGVETVLHTATLHKPHVVSHPREAFVETNVLGTLILLEEARRVARQELCPHQHDERLRRRSQAAPGRAGGLDRRKRGAGAEEHLWRHQDRGRGSLPAFPSQRGARLRGPEDVALLPRGGRRSANAGGLRRRQREGERVPVPPRRDRGRGRGASAWPPSGRPRSGSENTSSAPRRRSGARTLRACARTRRRLSAERACGWEDEYARRGWRMFPTIDRVYDNALARRELGWRPAWDFESVIGRLRETGDIRGPLAKVIGEKGYHAGRRYPARDALAERGWWMTRFDGIVARRRKTPPDGIENLYSWLRAGRRLQLRQIRNSPCYSLLTGNAGRAALGFEA